MTQLKEVGADQTPQRDGGSRDVTYVDAIVKENGDLKEQVRIPQQLNLQNSVTQTTSRRAKFCSVLDLFLHIFGDLNMGCAGVFQLSNLQTMSTRQEDVKDAGQSSRSDKKLSQDYLNLQQESERMKEHMHKLEVGRGPEKLCADLITVRFPSRCTH